MFKKLAYKEWLKIRWFYLGCMVIGFAVIISILLNLRVLFEFQDASTIWYYVVFKNYLYYGDFRYIPLLIAVIIGISQFYPEMQNQRLKLNLHLPADENRMILTLVLYGLTLIISLDAIFTFFLSWITFIYFPVQVFESMLFTILPWFTAGITAYFIAAAVMIEQLWGRRIILLIIGYGLINFLITDVNYLAYSRSISAFIIITILTGVIIFLSGYRFKTGVR